MAESKRDYHEVLGVPKDANDDVLKKTYRKLTKKYHSDANPGDKKTEAKFKGISEACDVLGDPQKHQRYDQLGHVTFGQDDEGAGGFGGLGGFDLNGNMGDIFGNIFGDIFGGGCPSRVRSGPMQGANIKTSIKISLEEVVFGYEREVGINFRETCANYHRTEAKAGTSPQICSECNGRDKIMYIQQSFLGRVQDVQACLDCNGTGRVIKERCSGCYGTGYRTVRKKFAAPIPAGIDNGQCVRQVGQGKPDINGGKRNDLLVEAVVPQHPIFKHQDTSIYPTVSISSAHTALGDPVRIKTVDGEAEYEVRPGTQTDTKVHLKGKGIPSLCSRNVRGDCYMTLVVQVPERMNQAQKEALRRFDNTVNGITLSEEGKLKKKGIFR